MAIRQDTAAGRHATILVPHAEAAMLGRLLVRLRPARIRISVYGNYSHVFQTSQEKNGRLLGKENKALL
jgi:hypothetical protein